MASQPREGVHFITKPFDEACPGCERHFNLPASLRVHKSCLEKRLTHLNHPYNRYECFECGKKFKEMQNLRQHVTFHLERMFHCLICGREEYTKQQVIRHVQCEHNNVKPFRCPHTGCGKGYSVNRMLKRHIERSHGKKNQVTESVSYASEEDDDSEFEPDHPDTLNQSDSDHVSQQLPDQPNDDLVIIPITPAIEAQPAPMPVVAVNTVSPEADQLTEFFMFQKFLKMMKHCDECDGYFMSEELLQAHYSTHLPPTSNPFNDGGSHQEAKPDVVSATASTYPETGASLRDLID